MVELEFDRMIVKNFLSIGNEEVEVKFDRGLSFVWGWNKTTNSSNGVGKTLLYFNAPLYALFGEATRGTKQNSLINYTNKSGLVVQLFLKRGSDTYEIYRSRKPNDFWFKRNGETFKNKDVYTTQLELNKFLDISYEIFKNAFLINASSVIDFVGDSGSVKLKENFQKIFFKDALFKRILDQIRKELNELLREIDRNTSIITEKEKFLITLNSYEDDKNSKIEIEKKIKLHKKALKVLESQLTKSSEKSDTSRISSQIEKLRKRYSIDISKKTTLESNLNHIRKDLNKLTNNMKLLTGDVKECPTSCN